MNQNIAFNRIEEVLEGVKSVGITGHVRPDGDCVGSCLGLYNYIRKNLPQIEVKVYLENFEEHFMFLNGADAVVHDLDGHVEPYDVFFVLDCGNMERTANFVRPYVNKAKKTVNLDHHVDGHDFATISHYIADISSTCELLYEVLDESKLDQSIAECLYTGLIHDTGVLKYRCTTKRTMEIAGSLMSLGIDYTNIIDDTFYRVSYAQNIMLAKAILDSKLYLDGKVISSHVDYAKMKEQGVTGKELGNIIDQLRLTKGVEVAIFTYELPDHAIKVSTRSVNYVDVNAICKSIGGGGHAKAAGATVNDSYENVTAKIVELVKEQIH